jgi:hypothetical protein
MQSVRPDAPGAPELAKSIDDQHFEVARIASTAESYGTYLSVMPNGAHASEARKALEAITKRQEAAAAAEAHRAEAAAAAKEALGYIGSAADLGFFKRVAVTRDLQYKGDLRSDIKDAAEFGCEAKAEFLRSYSWSDWVRAANDYCKSVWPDANWWTDDVGPGPSPSVCIAAALAGDCGKSGQTGGSAPSKSGW